MNAQPAGWFPDPTDQSQFRYWDGSAWTDHRSARFESVGPTAFVRPPPPLGPTGKWYFVITIASAGLLASVPYFHAASKLDRPQLRKTGAALAVTAVVCFALIGLSPEDDAGDPSGPLATIGAVVMFGVVVLACLQLISIRRDVYQAPATAQAMPSRNRAAVATVAESRRKRDEARKLAASDPMMARELGIGRPALNSGYDDGGLLDLNAATADELSTICGLPPDVAESVVTSRSSLGAFLQVEDAIVFGQIGEQHAPLVRDRGIVIGDR